MTITATVRYQQSYRRLMQACTDLMDGNNDRAKKDIGSLVLHRVDESTSNEALLGHIASAALMRRIDRQLMASKNIYLQDFDVPQIVLFYKMLEAYPQVAASHRVANQFVVRKMARTDHATLVDIGVGKGKQVVETIKAASHDNRQLERVDVVGLDPDPANVSDSAAVVEQLKQEVSADVVYHPMCRLLEDLTEDDYRFIAGLGGTLLINSAFTMHHISHPVGDRDKRTEYFARLRALSPAGFTLVEPHSDHDEERLSRRLHNCWSHFSTVFELIDRSSIGVEHRFLVKRKFFGREIENILGVSDHLRSERHEPMDRWLLRLTKAGFGPIGADGITVEMPDYCDHDISAGMVSLGYDSTPLVAVFGFESV